MNVTPEQMNKAMEIVDKAGTIAKETCEQAINYSVISSSFGTVISLILFIACSIILRKTYQKAKESDFSSDEFIWIISCIVSGCVVLISFITFFINLITLIQCFFCPNIIVIQHLLNYVG